MEKPTNEDSKEGPSRRQVLAGLGASAVVVAGVAAGMVGGREETRGEENLDFGSDNIESESYASWKYFNHGGGKLKELYRAWRAVGERVKSGPPTKNITERDKISAEIKSLTNPVDTEKASLLAEFDKTLIPELLVEFIQHKSQWPRGTPQEMLIRAYRDAGGVVDDVSKNGHDGITPSVVDNIYSKMEFLIELTGWLKDHEFGKTTWSKLSFGLKQDSSQGFIPPEE